MKRCGVYVIITPNNEVYVGASKNLDERIRSYNAKERLCERPTSISIMKYGFDAHDVSVIEECNPEKLSELERFYIHYFKSLGFNMLNLLHVKNPVRITYGERTKIDSWIMKIGRTVVRAIEKKNLTTRSAAKKIGIKYVRLKSIENGRGHLIDFSEYIRVLDFYGFDITLIDSKVL